ncbi:MAG: sigma-70 family RNA polymerase sigma factor [Acidobacteria bacterium]|nr:sigma-70 family RNA polymerase sigma factor [Acidobacteriota bacterium]
MDTPNNSEVTQLLANLRKGQHQAHEQLFPIVYNELRKIAANYMRRERTDHTLQATALVHEAYMQLVDQTRVTWQNRAHFFGVAAQLMRRILVDHARSQNALKRGGDAQKISLDDSVGLAAGPPVAFDELDEALNRLHELDPNQAKIIELRFFGGLTVEEVSEVIGLSTATIEREWRMAKAWLHNQLTATRPHRKT